MGSIHRFNGASKIEMLLYRAAKTTAFVNCRRVVTKGRKFLCLGGRNRCNIFERIEGTAYVGFNGPANVGNEIIAVRQIYERADFSIVVQKEAVQKAAEGFKVHSNAAAKA